MTSNTREKINSWVNVIGLIMLPLLFVVLGLVIEIKSNIAVLNAQMQDIRYLREELATLRKDMAPVKSDVDRLKGMHELEGKNVKQN